MAAEFTLSCNVECLCISIEYERPVSKRVYCIFCWLILLTIPITILSLSLVTHNPRLYIEDIYIPGLSNSTTQSSSSNNATTRLNTFMFVDVVLENIMPFNGIRYGDVNLTFFYGNRSLPAVASHTVPGFYQGNGKTAHKRAVVRAPDLPWDVAFAAVADGSTVVLGVDLATTVKLKRCGAYTKRKPLVLGADIRVDASGEEVQGKSVRLRK